MLDKKYSRIAGFSNDSIVDGPGIRYTVFYQGCAHRCEKCHNPETHDFNGGKLVENDTIIENIRKNPLLDGVTLSGGDPIFQINSVIDLCQKIKSNFPHLNIILYTGFTFEELLQNETFKENIEVLLRYLDYIIDGKYVDSLRDLTLSFRGSKNQRVVNVKESLKNNNVTTIEW